MATCLSIRSAAGEKGMNSTSKPSSETARRVLGLQIVWREPGDFR